MRALSFVELRLDYCVESYGVAPCQAVMGTQEEVDSGDATGTRKCVNTPRTCQDREHFNNSPVTMLLGKTSQAMYSDIEALYSIVSIEYTPATLSLGENMGERGSVRVIMDDHTHSDVGPGFDKYWNQRGVDPKTQGTIWGKFRARHRYIRGRPLRLIRGQLGQTLEEMESSLFIVDSYTWTPDGKFVIVAKDALKQLDGDRAQAPVASNGVLLSAINSSVTTATLGPSGIGDIEYPASGFGNIGGKETVAFTRVDDVVTLTRGQYNSSASSHDAGERFQLCLEYVSEDPADIIADLMINYADVDPDHVPVEDWRAETLAHYQRVNSALITEPTSVETLVNELIEQCGLAVWWSPTQSVIRLQVLREISTDARVFSEDTNIVQDSLQVEEQPSKRISEVWTYYGLTNPLLGVDNESNFRSIKLVPSTLELEYSQPSIKRILSRWIAYGGLSAATRVGDLQVGRFQDAPRRLSFRVMRRDEEPPPVLGEGCIIRGTLLQTDIGTPESVRAQITRVRPDDSGYDVEAEEMIFESVGDQVAGRSVSIDNDINNVNIRSMYDLLYPEPIVGDIVTAVVNSGVIVGSTSPGLYSMDIGDWPSQEITGNTESGSPVIAGLSISTDDLVEELFISGPGITGYAQILTIDDTDEITLDQNVSATATGAEFTLYTVLVILDNRGMIRGCGGPSGNGGFGGDQTPGSNGGSGGHALRTRYPTLLRMIGDIKSGGGGGAGGASNYAWPWGPQYYGRPGGSGAGRLVGTTGGSLSGAGNPGSLNTGGSGVNNGMGWTSGSGGSPGNPGGNSSGGDQRFGGPAGYSVDGWSFITEDVVTGPYAGAKVN